MPIKAVIDTNVLISSLMASQGNPYRIFAAWQQGKFTLVISDYMLQELRHVLIYPRIASRLRLNETELAVVLKAFTEKSEIVIAPRDLSGATRDPKDDPVVACAVTGQADYLVSGDQDILVLRTYNGVQMVTAVAFVQILNTQSFAEDTA
ncbi:MAG TPA: putative toxin-antitoxin system toxin component, PIN family [Anaerolineae bacterium]|nr:putative toxin-antitoxin system toxin component, PIN family [Anaerolineae bacterium]HIP73887.1 putative toxin-antitoxin system toxin component, PIN family [Anaerolineae bacterium]